MVLKTDSRASQTALLRAENADLLPAIIAAGLGPRKPSCSAHQQSSLGRLLRTFIPLICCRHRCLSSEVLGTTEEQQDPPAAAMGRIHFSLTTPALHPLCQSGRCSYHSCSCKVMGPPVPSLTFRVPGTTTTGGSDATATTGITGVAATIGFAGATGMALASMSCCCCCCRCRLESSVSTASTADSPTFRCTN